MVLENIKERLRVIIFGTDTPLGKGFDLVIIFTIILSVLVVVIDSISVIHNRYANLLYWMEWSFTILFTLEYGLRIFSSQSPRRYIFSIFGIIDLIAIIPTYLSIIFVGSQYLMVVRVLRILRIFRVLKLFQYIGEANHLMQSIKNSSKKIVVFLFFVLLLTIIFGSVMYVVEGPEHGFTSIPRGIYWSIVTMTTVGYGDISPQTNLGQLIAAIVMLFGYSIIAVPTGIVSSELAKQSKINLNDEKDQKFCRQCRVLETDSKAVYCKYCRTKLV